MSWEVQGAARRYYYRVRRLGGRLVRTYVGKGPLAWLAAAQDSQERAEREAHRQQARDERRRLEAAEAAAQELAEQAELVLRAALLVAGYRRHDRGEWRRRRHDDKEG
jgi:hypothetical protein